MHLHILGICGTFMGGIAAIARAAGHKVTGSDRNVYPPMSTQLAELGIEITEGFDESQLKPRPDVVVVGNVMARGAPVIEALLDSTIPYASGPEWLAREVLRERWVLGVAGTHGKTTTSSMLAWILEHAGLDPGFLIGGVPGNFPVSARLGGRKFFVIEVWLIAINARILRSATGWPIAGCVAVMLLRTAVWILVVRLLFPEALGTIDPGQAPPA
jgi:UDP-N-acetylmuramate: L-alanyl-gamma-D-glutamyl-meso-diaminopimelate ligase